MLPRRNRLTQKSEFENVFKSGRLLKRDFLILRFFPNNLSYPRFGFIISTKVSKKSTLRNRLRRWLREIARSIVKSDFDKGADIVVSLTPEARDKEFRDIKDSFEKILKQTGIN